MATDRGATLTPHAQTPRLQEDMEVLSNFGEESAYEHVTPRGELRIWLAAPTVLVFKYRGHADASYVDFLEETVERLFGSRDGIHLFIDGEEQTGFDAEFRRRITAFSKGFEPRTLTFCALARSRIVAFGMAVVKSLVGGKGQATSNRNVFNSRLELAVRQSNAEAARTSTIVTKEDAAANDVARSTP